MANEGLYAAIAGCALVGGMPAGTVEHFERSERNESRELGEYHAEQADLLDQVVSLTDKMRAEITEYPASTKHGDDCWKRHTLCLLDRIDETAGVM